MRQKSVPGIAQVRDLFYDTGVVGTVRLAAVLIQRIAERTAHGAVVLDKDRPVGERLIVSIHAI